MKYVAVESPCGFHHKLNRLFDTDGVILNVGSGGTDLGVNIDLHKPGCLRLDAAALEGIPDNFAHLVVALQILEHLPMTRVTKALREWNRVLRPGGKLVIAVPDFDGMVDIYKSAGEAAIYAINKMLFFNHEEPGMGHMCVFTEFSLREYLGLTGFTVDEVCEGYPPAFTPSLCAIATKE